MSGTTDLQSLPPPAVLTSAGAQPQTPQALLTALTALVQAAVPGYTNNLPGGLIEDLSSTAVGALIICDQARVELLNSVSPYSANPFLLALLAAGLGIPAQGAATNATVPVVFTGPPGYVLGVGFTVSDGTNQYALVDGGVIGSAPEGESVGQSQPLTARCTTSGIFAIPADTVVDLVTDVPSAYSVSVNNPLAGTPATTGETLDAFSARVLQAQAVGCQGSPAYLKTLLFNIPGVVQQQVSVRQTGSGFEVIVGGGDAYLIAGAIYLAMPDVSALVGSTLGVAAVTQANPGVVTTNLNHGYETGQVVTFSGVGGMTELNSGSYTITVITEISFSIGVNTTGFPAYTTGGKVLPNFRNVTVDVIDVPDTYAITFVLPPQQTVSVQFTWDTYQSNFVAGASVAQLGQPAIINYINGIVVGQPINLNDMNVAFAAAVSSVVPTQYLSVLSAVVEINGVSVSPESGTQLIFGDPESYFFATTGSVTVTQSS